ncbi:MAG TPA: rhodanese-like domain-containing protein [Rhizomicrobium sp.]|nr:rhodanese-like domain-containing protein [Rhizomicrobium sp.]
MRNLNLSLFFAAALAVASTAHAADSRDQLVVTPTWLAQHAGDKDLVILHAGNAKSFQAGHIAGAHLADLDQVTVSDPQGLSTELPSAEVLRQQLEALGISDNSRILVYSDSETIPRATRILLTLDAAGFGHRSYLLDGGLNEWKAEGHAVTMDSAAVTPGHLKPLTLDPAIVTADFVQAHLKTPGYDVIDGRAPNFYSGEQASMGGKGHLPGAHNIPFTTITGADGKMKSADELRQMFTAAGYNPGDHVIAYCHIGIQATAVVFAARTLGIDAKLYDGSFQDWVKRGLPVETGVASN